MQGEAMIRGQFQRQENGNYFGYVTMPSFEPSFGFREKRVWGRLIPYTCRFDDHAAEYLRFEADL